MKQFVITTSKDVALNIEKFFRSGTIAENRSIALKRIIHSDGYSDVCVTQANEDKPIEPQDIFWMGFYSYN